MVAPFVVGGGDPASAKVSRTWESTITKRAPDDPEDEGEQQLSRAAHTGEVGASDRNGGPPRRSASTVPFGDVDVRQQWNRHSRAVERVAHDQENTCRDCRSRQTGRGVQRRHSEYKRRRTVPRSPGASRAIRVGAPSQTSRTSTPEAEARRQSSRWRERPRPQSLARRGSRSKPTLPMTPGIERPDLEDERGTPPGRSLRRQQHQIDHLRRSVLRMGEHTQGTGGNSCSAEDPTTDATRISSIKRGQR